MNQFSVPDSPPRADVRSGDLGPPPATLEVVPLGGLGEFGMNMMAIS